MDFEKMSTRTDQIETLEVLAKMTAEQKRKEAAESSTLWKILDLMDLDQDGKLILRKKS